MKNLKEQFLNHQSKRHHICIDRKIADTFRIHGFVLGCTSNFVLIHIAEDFHLDGCQILRIPDIKFIRHSSSDRVMDKIFKAEGEKKKIGLDFDIDLTNWQSIFRSLKVIGENIIVEGEDPDLDEFIIGKIKRVNPKSVSLLNFDGSGLWDEMTTSCPYDEITSMKFRCEYINIFSKYVKDK